MTGVPRHGSITVRPNFSRPNVRVGFSAPPTSREDAEYIRTILASTPGCTKVTHRDGDVAFWVYLDDNSDQAKIAAQCYIEQAFFVPHLFACKWHTARLGRDANIDYELGGFLFLEPVANSLASTLMARLTQLFVQLETLHLDNHIFVLRLGLSRPATHTYSDVLTDTPIQVYGITNADSWNPKWGLKEFLAWIQEWR